MMLGAFCGLAAMILLGFPFWLAVVAVILAMAAAFGLLLETMVIRSILGQPAFSVVMLTFGIGLRGARADHDGSQQRAARRLELRRDDPLLPPAAAQYRCVAPVSFLFLFARTAS